MHLCTPDPFLWAINGSAAEYRLIDPSHGYLEAKWVNPPVPIAPQRITMGELGQLGNDGIRWVTLPNNVTKTITPTVNGVKYYSFDANATKYSLHILANDSVLARDRLRSGATFCVGQYMQFSPIWSPGLPSGTVESPVQWSFEGVFVNKSWQLWCGGDEPFGGPCGSVNYTNDPTLLQNKVTSAWWTSGTNPAPAVYVANLGESLTFLNGQHAALATKGSFGMYRPAIAGWTEFYQGAAQILITNGLLCLGSDPIKGMSFETDVTSKFAGMAGFTQLIKGDFEDDWSFVYSDYRLDNEVWPRGQSFISAISNPNLNTFDDSPFISLSTDHGKTSMSLSLHTYLRFRPNVGDTNQNIFVTLQRISWGVSCSATKSGDVWSVDAGSSISGPDPANSLEFPVWEDVFSNL